MKFPRSLRFIVLGALLAVAGLAAASSFAFGLGSSTPEQFGLAIRQILSRPSDGATVAVVNGSAITQRELDIEIATRQFSGASTDRTSALQSLITERVVIVEAAKEGLAVSDAELGAFVDSQHQIADQDAERHFYGYAAGLGQSQASIWSYKPLLDEWRRHMLVAKLKHAVLGDVTQKTLDAKEAQWATYVQTLRASAQVVVK